MNDLQSLSDDELTRLYKSQSTESLKSLSDDDLVKAYRAEKGELPDGNGLDPVVPNAQNHLMQPEEKDDRGLMTRVLDAATDGYSKGYGEGDAFDGSTREFIPVTPQTTGLNKMLNYLADGGEAALRNLTGLVHSGAGVGAQLGRELGMSDSEAKRFERDLIQIVDSAAIVTGAPSATTSNTIRKIGDRPVREVMKTAQGTVSLPGKAVPETLKRPFKSDDTVAADILNKTLERAGKSPDDIMRDFDEGVYNSRFGSNSFANTPESLAELGGEATQSLLEQTVIAPGPARSIVKDRINARQRGTRDPYSTEARPSLVADQQATMGQRERLLDNLARSLQIKDSPTAIKTSKQIEADLKRQAGPLYKKSFTQADEFDVSPALQKTLADIGDMAGGMRSTMVRAVRLFNGALKEDLPANVRLKRFDYSKKALDDIISSKKRAGENEVVRSLTILRNDLLDAVHGGNKASPTRNTYYASARDLWSGGKQLQDAIELGRRAMREGSEVTADMLKGMTQGEVKMFRLGLYDAVKSALGRKKATDDSTQIFRRADFAELHKAVAPHRKSKKALVKPSDQFGDLLNREHRMVETKALLGNSRTAFRLEGQKDFDRLAAFSNRMRNGGLVNAVIDTVSVELQTFFGMRENVSKRLAEVLTSTDRRDIKRAMDVLRRNYGKDGAERAGQMLLDVMADNESALRASVVSGDN